MQNPKPTRVIVHAGFHKTGTTSLQKYLQAHRGKLDPYFRFYGQNDFAEAGARARIYAQKRFPWRLARFRRRFNTFLDTVPDAPVIVLSRETFAGVMPGHLNWRRQVIQSFTPAAIPLCKVVIASLRQRFGADVEIEFLFTTRAQETWIKSVYGHLLRSIHLQQDFLDWRKNFPNLINLPDEANRMAQALAPVPVHVRAMEDYQDTHSGIATMILELTDVPRAICTQLRPARRENIGQPKHLEAQFLELNRSGKSKDALRTIKDRMRREATE